MPGLNYSRDFRSDPSGRGGAESFWNFFGHGLRPWCLSQFQMSFPVASRWMPAPSDNICAEPWRTSLIEFDSAHTKK